MNFPQTVFNTSAALLLATALAASPAQAEKRVALTIGIDAYQNLNADQQLRKAVNDSRSVGAALAAVGFEVIGGEDLQRLDFNRTWQRFLNRIEPGDTVAFFFAGHGVEIGGLNFLLARDVPKVAAGEEELLKGEAIGVSRLLDDLRARQPKVSLLILDACRNNPFQQEGGRSVGGSRGLARVEAPEGTFVMFSAGTGEAALDRLADNDGAANSIYTRRLVPLLTQPGLTLPDLAQEVRRQVRDLAASVKHRQTPAYYDEIVGRFCLASCEGGKPPAQVAAAVSAPIAQPPPPADTPKIAAPDLALPTDLPVRPDVLRTIETDPFFANAPPVRVGSHTIVSTVTSVTGGASTLTSNFNDETTSTWLRPGLIRSDLKQNQFTSNSGALGTYATRSSSLGAANGLFTVSYSMVNTSKQTRMSTTSQLVRISKLVGHVFPVTLGNRFSYETISEWKSSTGYSGGSTSVSSCAVTRKFDARSFHANLSGNAFLLTCDDRTTDKKGTVTNSKSLDIFIEMLGIWVKVDPVAPKEAIVSNNDISVSSGYTTVTNGSYTLTAFTLVR